MRDLLELFNEYFELVRADTPELLEQVFCMRYNVYCHEHDRFPCFDSCNHPAQLETDEYDHRSVHYLCRHRPSGADVGSVRLVLPDPKDPLAFFPTEKYEGSSLYEQRIANPNIPSAHIAEISRLCITKQFRLRTGEAFNPQGISNNPTTSKTFNSRRFPHPILALFVAIVRMSVDNNISYWYVLMDRLLTRLIGRYGVKFTPVGRTIEAYGPRQPCLSRVEDVLQGIYDLHPEVWRLITNDGMLMKSDSCHLRSSAIWNSTVHGQ